MVLTSYSMQITYDHLVAFLSQHPHLSRSPTEVTLLRKSFDMLLLALGNDREAVAWRAGRVGSGCSAFCWEDLLVELEKTMRKQALTISYCNQ
jgi:hypothetical protein